MRMVRDDLYITVPSFFKCPISLDVMKSPVSLCTGVTYDRSSIQKWLDSGNNTCPATMQTLHSKDFVPNHTLHRLIRIWADSVGNRNDFHSSASPSMSKEQARDLIRGIETRSGNWFNNLSKIAGFAKESEENRKILSKIEGFVPAIVGLITGGADIAVVEHVISILDLILTDFGDKEQLMRLMLTNDRDILSPIVLVLHKGSLESRVGSARVLEAIALDAHSKLMIAEKKGLLSELLRLVSSETDSSAIEAGLSCLISLSMPRRIKMELLRLEAVPILGKLLSQTNSTVSIIEKVLNLLEMVAACTEGRTAICQEPACVPVVLQKLTKVSSPATEHAVAVLWSVCYLSRDQEAQEAVTKHNGLTKFLLLMQSNCSPIVRKMCGDLMKIFRVNSKSCLSSYETRTTHIMPF